MPRHSLAFLTVLALGVLLAAPQQRARACGGLVCQPQRFLLPDEGEVPVNAPGIGWFPGYDYDDLDSDGGVRPTPPSALQFRCADASGTWRDVAFGVEEQDAFSLIVVDQPLVVGESCEIASDCAGDLTTWLRFSVTTEAPLPTGSLGTLTTTGARWSSVGLQSPDWCDLLSAEACTADVVPTIGPALQPWLDLLVFETLVDGVAWHTGSRNVLIDPLNPPNASGNAPDRVFVANPATRGWGLSTDGLRAVMMRARLVGTDIVLTSDPLEITLSCEPRSDGCDAGDVCDAGTGVDASTRPGTATTGCSCSTIRAGSDRPPTWLWALAAFVIACSRRRKYVAPGPMVAGVLAALWLVACTDEPARPQMTTIDAGTDAPMQEVVQPSISIGIPDAVTGIRYEPLAEGGDVRLETYGQGGLHAVFVIQCVGMGNQAWIEISMTNLGDYDRAHDFDAGGDDAGVDDGDAGVANAMHDFPGHVATLPSMQPSLLACDDLRDPVYCRSMPREVLTGGLAENVAALRDLHVEIRAQARNRDGVMLSDTVNAYLRR